jgi:hypothetical protein
MLEHPSITRLAQRRGDLFISRFSGEVYFASELSKLIRSSGNIKSTD